MIYGPLPPPGCLHAVRSTSTPLRARLLCRSHQQESPSGAAQPAHSRRTQLLGLNVAVLASFVDLAGERPSNLGVKDYGSLKSLALCPSKRSCVSTSEEANLESKAFVAPW